MSEEKKAYQEKMEASIQQLNAEIEKLEGKAKSYQADAKIQANRALASLKERKDQLASKLEEMKASSGDSWKDFQGNLNKAYEDIKTAITNAASRFK